jgi:hypothetical protein
MTSLKEMFKGKKSEPEEFEERSSVEADDEADLNEVDRAVKSNPISTGLVQVGGVAVSGVTIVAVGALVAAIGGAFGSYKLVKWLKK